MRQFSIKELERFSGIKAHTIRTWENRYAVLKPKRTAGNIRNYTIEEASLLLDIGLLVKYGFRISSLSKLSREELARKKAGLTTEEMLRESTVHSLLRFMFTADIDEFDSSLDNCINAWGIDITIRHIILPFLEKADILSYKDGSAEVHFAVTAVRKKLILGIESVKTGSAPKCTALLFLPKGEHYDLMLLYMAYIIKLRGMRILYLGTNVPRENLQQVVIDKQPDLLFTYSPGGNSYDSSELRAFLGDNTPGAKLCIAEAKPVVRRFTNGNVHFFHYKDVDKAVALHMAI